MLQLTNPMSAKSDQSADDADSEQEVVQNDVSGEIKYQNDSCQSHSSDENNIDNNHRDNAINEDRCEEMSAKDESFRLIQSEKSFQHNNKAGQVLHKPGMGKCFTIVINFKFNVAKKRKNKDDIVFHSDI